MEFKSLSSIALLLLLPFAGWLGWEPTSDTPKPQPESRYEAGITNLMEAVEPPKTEAYNKEEALSAANNAAAQDFTMEIFQRTLQKGENSLTSPFSVLYALGMTANGAANTTLSQMEQGLGLPAGRLNQYLAAYSASLSEDTDNTLQTANSIWLKADPKLKVEEAFLQTNAAFYQAGIYTAPFNAATVQAINRWVSDHTNQMIPQIIQKLPEETVMCLVNAVAFDAKWASPFTEEQVRPGDFTTAGGQKLQVDFMYSSVYDYLEGSQYTGFLRSYRGGRYAFCALLPNENVNLWDWAAKLDGKQLRELLSGRQQVEVHCSIPKFSAEYSAELGSILQAMGMSQAFDPNLADFSSMASYTDANIYIGAVLHKAKIEVNEQGTKAGAATAVMMNATTAYMPREYKEVYLNRPFVYMLLDEQTDLPIFIGVCANVK